MTSNAPPDYNTAFSGLPGAAPYAASNQIIPRLPPTRLRPKVSRRRGQLWLITSPVRPRRLGKSDRDPTQPNPFGSQQLDIWDPNTFAPPVGMVMANVPTAPQSSLQEWPATVAAPFGPQAPTQASPQTMAQGPQAPQGQAPPYDPSIFDARSTQSQVPANLFDLPPTQQQTPPNVASVIGRSGQPETPEERDAREALERDLANLGPIAPTPPAPTQAPQTSNLAGKSDRDLTREEIQNCN